MLKVYQNMLKLGVEKTFNTFLDLHSLQKLMNLSLRVLCFTKCSSSNFKEKECFITLKK